jgi:peptidyl-prolyl isomerase E (cyclophilin E)
MSTTLVAVGGKGANPKTTLYVGGLEESVNESTLHAAFIPFGDLKDVNVPLDHATGKHRGFGFVEFEDKDDAAAAVDNMHNSELFGRVLRVNFAQPARIKGGDKGFATQPVWADADKYIEELAAEQELEGLEREQRKKRLEDEVAAARKRDATAAAGEGGDDPMEALEAAAG